MEYPIAIITRSPSRMYKSQTRNVKLKGIYEKTDKLVFEYLSKKWQYNYAIEETLEEPLECVNARVNALLVQVFLELGQELAHDFIVMRLEPQQLGKALDKEAVHSVLGVDHKAMQSPKCILLVVQVHEEQCGNLGHALAVTQLRVVDGVGC